MPEVPRAVAEQAAQGLAQHIAQNFRIELPAQKAQISERPLFHDRDITKNGSRKAASGSTHYT
jgi:hypothetical protein